jgi:hypothetical protein
VGAAVVETASHPPRAPVVSVGPAHPLPPFFFEAAHGACPLPPGHGRRALRLAGRDRGQAASACSPTLEILGRRMRGEASAVHGVALAVLVGASDAVGARLAWGLWGGGGACVPLLLTRTAPDRLCGIAADSAEKRKGTERKEKVLVLTAHEVISSVWLAECMTSIVAIHSIRGWK